ncbi:MAG: prepilin-type N-terminal cleavage/methylation domain-containing protein [Candidatus Riflebacteria bacterium]|nr:prepilin-type N-terminal cleavage/methylation domain-containing protein [Candidatus Riflebacteria bacterium]
MMYRRGRAFSLLEVLVATVVIGLAVGPLINVLSSSNRVSNASIYEVMAVHYASELAEQLQRLSSQLKSMCNGTGKTVKQLLEDPTFLAELGSFGNGSLDPQLIQIPGTRITLFLSPLHPRFTCRTILVSKLNTTTQQILKLGTFWNATIALSWNLAEGEVEHSASFSVILRED